MENFGKLICRSASSHQELRHCAFYGPPVPVWHSNYLNQDSVTRSANTFHCELFPIYKPLTLYCNRNVLSCIFIELFIVMGASDNIKGDHS